MKLSELKQKIIAIWGFGVEGISAAKYLSEHHISFVILAKPNEAIPQYEFNYNEVTTTLLDQFDVVIKSPGISPYQNHIQESNAQFTSSTAIWFANEKSNDVIAITGTKGKSTTSSLLQHVLESEGIPSRLVGNIGEPLLSLKQNDDLVILECSSYQIYDGEIQSEIAVITNLFPEHLDWHVSVDNYFNDKLKIFNHAEHKLINVQNDDLVTRTKGHEVETYDDQNSYWVNHDVLQYKDEALLSLKDILLLGAHNLQNMAAVLSVCKQLGLNQSSCINHLKTFQSLPHRLQMMGKIGEHLIVNDSISTTPFATIAALKSLQNYKDITLIVGGYDRGLSWKEWANQLELFSLNAILITGENSESIFNAIKPYDLGQIRIERIKDFQKTVKRATELTPVNGLILLSPGSPSFDSFENYIQRGKGFIDEVKKNINH